MKVSIQLTDGRDFTINKDSVGLLPIVLKVPSLDKKKLLSEHSYALALEYTFRGVINLVNSKIKKVIIEKGYWGKIEKNMTEVKWETLVDKTYIVSYTLSRGVLEENMYVADGYSKDDKGNIRLNYLDDLLKYENSKNKEVIKEQLKFIVGVFNSYYKGNYKLRYTKKDGLHVINKNGMKINNDDIEDDFVYTYVVLSTSLLLKGLHLGVFFINAGVFQEDELNMFYLLIKLFFGDTFMFLYNVEGKLPFIYEELQLPSLYEE